MPWPARLPCPPLHRSGLKRMYSSVVEVLERLGEEQVGGALLLEAGCRRCCRSCSCSFLPPPPPPPHHAVAATAPRLLAG